MKTTVLAAIAVLASSAATAQTDEWYATDKALAGTALALTVVDMGQTITKDFLASAAAVEFRMAYHNFSANVYWSWK